MVGPHPLLARSSRGRFLRRGRRASTRVENLRDLPAGASSTGSRHRAELGGRQRGATYYFRWGYEDFRSQFQRAVGRLGDRPTLRPVGGDPARVPGYRRHNYMADIRFRLGPQVDSVTAIHNSLNTTIILVPVPLTVIDSFQGQSIRRDLLTGFVSRGPDPSPGEVRLP